MKARDAMMSSRNKLKPGAAAVKKSCGEPAQRSPPNDNHVEGRSPVARSPPMEQRTCWQLRLNNEARHFEVDSAAAASTMRRSIVL